MARKVSYTFSAIDKFSGISARIRSQVEKTNASFRKLGLSMRESGKNVQKFGRNMRTTSLVAGAATVGSVKAFSDLEKGIVNVYTLMSKDEIDKYGKKIKRLADESVAAGFTIGDTTKSLFDTVSALGAGEAAFDTFRTGQILAKSGVTELSTAIDGVTSIMNAYKSENLAASDVANAFFSGQVKGKTNVDRLASSIGQVAPIAKSAGIGYKEMIATMSQLTLGGLSTEESATSLKGVLQSLLKPGKEAEAILGALGVPMGATELASHGLAGTLEKLAQVQEQFPDHLAKAIPNIRGYIAAAALGRPEIKNLRDIVNLINKDIKDGTGMMDAYAMQTATLSDQMGRASGATKLVAAGIGEKLAPIVSFIADRIIDLYTVFTNLSDVWKNVISFGLVLFAGLSTVLTLVGGAMIFFGKAAVMAALPFIAWPILIGGIVLALTALAAWVYNNWEKVTGVLSAGLDKVTGWFGSGLQNMMFGMEHSVNSKAQMDITNTIVAPRGMVESTNVKTTGSVPGLNVATNMVESQ